MHIEKNVLLLDYIVMLGFFTEFADFIIIEEVAHENN
jgi:hypothetical protein